MILKQSRVTFGVLAAAFFFSALYQAYRAAIMEVPEYDGFSLSMGVIYLAFVGVSALVLTDRRWAWILISAFVLLLLAVGVFWYYPVVAAARMEAGAMGVIGWLEGTVYTGLLLVAGFICVLRLFGAHLVPNKS